jgi:hypothetical protein
MTFMAKTILTEAATLLIDVGGIRWPYAEVLGWINEATREIANAKPSATSETIEVSLIQGTLQTLPAGYHQMLDATRNLLTLTGSPLGRSGGRVITPTTRAEIDSLVPGWHSPDVLPYAREVYAVLDDDNDPTAFFVVPGNDGTGVIELVASKTPTPIALPVTPEDLAAYTAPVPIRDAYQSAVLDFVLYRCHSKEVNVPSSAAKAQAHFALYQGALGIKAASEAEQNVNRPKSRYQR